MKAYRMPMTVIREVEIAPEVIAAVYANAAAILEEDSTYGVHHAITKASDHLPEHVYRFAFTSFYERFGVWSGNDEGVTMLCFAAALAKTGDL